MQLSKQSATLVDKTNVFIYILVYWRRKSTQAEKEQISIKLFMLLCAFLFTENRKPRINVRPLLE